MTRRKAAVIRKITPDPLFENVTLAKCINYVMLNGKKSVAEHIVYGALDIVVQNIWEEKEKEKSDEQNSDQKADSNKKTAKRVRPKSVREDGRAREIAEEVFEKAVSNLKPQVEVCSHRVGGAAYQVPKTVRTKRRLDLALRWLVQFSRSSRERYKSMAESLGKEILDAYRGRGNAIKKRDEMHRMAKSNQTFEHYSN